MGQEVVLAQYASTNYSTGFRNRIINGDMRIDQRNNGATNTATNVTYNYNLDRYNLNLSSSGAAGKMTYNQSTDVPTGYGFTKSISVQTITAWTGSNNYDGFTQSIEGSNIADLMWGTAYAQPATLSFWVKMGASGTYWLSISNLNDLSYVASYTVNSPGTWEFKTITVPGPTTGTWLNTTGIGAWLAYDLGSNTNLGGTANTWSAGFNRRITGGQTTFNSVGAYMRLTGIQFEAGTYATPFEFRQYTTELQLCQRYFYRQYGIAWTLGIINQSSGSWTLTSVVHPTTMRIAPTFGHNLTDAKRISGSPSADQWSVYNQNVGWGSISFSPASTFEGIFNGGASTTQGHAGGYYTTFSAGATHIRLGSNVYVEWSAEY